mgnify:FL=1
MFSGTKLITKNDELYLKQGESEHKVLKGWESMNGWYWFATELNNDGLHFGYVQGTYPEWGHFHQEELKSIPTVWEIPQENLAISGRMDD